MPLNCDMCKKNIVNSGECKIQNAVEIAAGMACKLCSILDNVNRDTCMENFGSANGWWYLQAEEYSRISAVLGSCITKNHKTVKMKTGKCLSEVVCVECDYKYTIDSSD